MPEPEWLSKIKLTKEEKEVYNKTKELIRKKFIESVKSGELKLPEKEKEGFERWQKQEGVKKEKEKESWYEKLMKEKVPTHIHTKIPTGTEYRGYKQGKEGDVEPYNMWAINCKEKDYPSEVERFRVPEKNELVVTKKEGLLNIRFLKKCALDPRYRDKRDTYNWITYKPPKEMAEKVWDNLKKNPPNAYQLIDPELLKLVSLPSDLKIVLEEKEEK